jgi:tetratricopeptide (TPR) repeat protein
MNDYVPNVAAIERSKSVLDQLQKHVEKEPWDVRRDRLRRELAAGGDYKVKNDLAVALAHTGEAAEAVTLFEQIEAEKPGLYATAANLGTAYELIGNDEKALEWIRNGIKLNPAAHEGTEWLHVRILEAKLALQADPTWLDSHSILGAHKVVQPIEFSATGNRGEKLSIDQVKAALIYQLHERLQFVQPPDPVVGALLLDLGELVAEEPPGLGSAKGVLDLAYVYLHGAEHVTKLQEAAARRSEFAESAQRTEGHGARPRLNMLTYLGMAGFVLSVAGIWIKRRLES